MRVADLPTPCLLLDQPTLLRNLDTMARQAARLGVALRPHMKTAKSIDVARLALARSPSPRSGTGAAPGAAPGAPLGAPLGAALGAGPGGITVSTLAEAEYFVGHGLSDILYAVGITPQKLDQVAKLNATGAQVMVITDDVTMASMIAGHAAPPRCLIEIDTGERRGGLLPEDAALLDIAARIGPLLAGVMTHSGHSYAGRSAEDMLRIAEQERDGALLAARRLAEAGYACPIVSIGSSPTALAATDLAGVTELRAGVYMFGDLFQAEIGTHAPSDIALSVLASVIGRRPRDGLILLDAGALALSKDRSTEATGNDLGFGLMVDLNGFPSYGRAVVRKAYQEHGVVALDPTQPVPHLEIGSKVRVLPNHCCLTAAAYDSYFVMDSSDSVSAIWPRINGW